MQMTPDEKSRADHLIADRLMSSDLYEKADALLVYISSQIEVGTHEIIRGALAAGKNVFAPRCISGTNQMQFCSIGSFEDLECGSWGILEPKQYCKVFSGSAAPVCITPALAYDPAGYRLGFGKGYYDRFLAGFEGVSIGLCYEACILESICRDSFDVPVDVIITENREIIIDDEREE